MSAVLHLRDCGRRGLIRPTGVAAGAAVLLLAAIPAGCNQFMAQSLNADGVRLYQQAQFREAAQEFQKAIATNPADADGYYNLAATYHRVGKLDGNRAELDQAEQLYNHCLDRNPEHRDCYRALAVLLVEEQRNSEAFRLLEGWADRYPMSGDARIELSRLLVEFGDPRAGEDQLLRALAVDPNNARAWAALGKIREDLGDRTQALTNYQRSLMLNDAQPELLARASSLQNAVGPVAVASQPPPPALRTAMQDTLPRR